MDTITLLPNDTRYPQLLKASLTRPCKPLFCKGDITLLNTPSIAVIGTREPTTTGRDVAYKIARHFAGEGYTIVSGLAAGCDTAGHRGALSVEGGKTIAILGTSLNRFYPRENTSLANDILEHGGLLITEYDTDIYAPSRFFERDHLQAALSRVVIPVQMGVKSGTRHTVEAAIAQKKGVFVPRPVQRDRDKNPGQYAGIEDLIAKEMCQVLNGKSDYARVTAYIQDHFSLTNE